MNSCAESVAMVINMSKHCKYIGATTGYMRDQILKHPDILDVQVSQVYMIQMLINILCILYINQESHHYYILLHNSYVLGYILEINQKISGQCGRDCIEFQHFQK